jgi:hypothetical protein
MVFVGSTLFFLEAKVPVDVPSSAIQRIGLGKHDPSRSLVFSGAELEEYDDYFYGVAAEGDRLVAMSARGELWTSDRFGGNKRRIGWLPRFTDLLGMHKGRAYVVLDEDDGYVVAAVDLEYAEYYPVTNVVPGSRGGDGLRQDGKWIFVDGYSGLTLLANLELDYYLTFEAGAALPCGPHDGRYYFAIGTELHAIDYETDTATVLQLPSSPNDCLGFFGDEIIYTEIVPSAPGRYNLEVLMGMKLATGESRLIVDPKPRSPLMGARIHDGAVYWHEPETRHIIRSPL